MSTLVTSGGLAAPATAAQLPAGGTGIGDLMASRWTGLGLVGITALQLGLSRLGVSGLPCPLHALTGLPCPGCGLSRAGIALLEGRFADAMAWHAFSPLFAVVFVAAGVLSVLPDRGRQRAVAAICSFERRVMPGTIVLAALIGYWLFRVVAWKWTGESLP